MHLQGLVQPDFGRQRDGHIQHMTGLRITDESGLTAHRTGDGLGHDIGSDINFLSLQQRRQLRGFILRGRNILIIEIHGRDPLFTSTIIDLDLVEQAACHAAIDLGVMAFRFINDNRDTGIGPRTNGQA